MLSTLKKKKKTHTQFFSVTFLLLANEIDLDESFAHELINHGYIIDYNLLYMSKDCSFGKILRFPRKTCDVFNKTDVNLEVW